MTFYTWPFSSVLQLLVPASFFSHSHFDWRKLRFTSIFISLNLCKILAKDKPKYNKPLGSAWLRSLDSSFWHPNLDGTRHLCQILNMIFHSRKFIQARMKISCHNSPLRGHHKLIHARENMIVFKEICELISNIKINLSFSREKMVVAKMNRRKCVAVKPTNLCIMHYTVTILLVVASDI